MVDNNKIGLYNAMMAANMPNAVKFPAFMLNGIAGNP